MAAWLGERDYGGRDDLSRDGELRDRELSTRAEASAMIWASQGKEEQMAPIVSSIEIARPPEEVFAYVIDPSRMAEWQESVVSARAEGGGPPAVGSKAITSRKIGRRERTMTMEITNISPPRSWTVRGIDGPVRGIVNGTVDPLDDGARSRVTIELDFEGHGLGKLLVPLVVRRQAQTEMPRNLRNLKERLESAA